MARSFQPATIARRQAQADIDIKTLAKAIKKLDAGDKPAPRAALVRATGMSVELVNRYYDAARELVAQRRRSGAS